MMGKYEKLEILLDNAGLSAEGVIRILPMIVAAFILRILGKGCFLMGSVCEISAIYLAIARESWERRWQFRKALLLECKDTVYDLEEAY